jgi:hypothetical protein
MVAGDVNSGPGLRFKRGDALEITLGNDTAGAGAPNWRGIDGVPAAEPLAGQPRTRMAQGNLVIPLRRAGTFCAISAVGRWSGATVAARALIVAESEAIAVDRDEVF